jgi:hypothetical protein
MKIYKGVSPAEWDKRTKRVNFNLRGIEKGIRDSFKARCAEAGVAMNEALIGLMEEVARGTLDLRKGKEGKK